jgi:hypothetical protein
MNLMPPDPMKICAQLEAMQASVTKLRDQQDDSSRVFEALTAVLGALRFAWHVVQRHAYEAEAMLERVESAVAKYRHSQGAETEPPMRCIFDWSPLSREKGNLQLAGIWHLTCSGECCRIRSQLNNAMKLAVNCWRIPADSLYRLFSCRGFSFPISHNWPGCC